MKRKIELPTYLKILHKETRGIKFTPIETLVDECQGLDHCVVGINEIVREALQEAYNQGHEDGRKAEADHMKAIKDIEGLI